MIVTRNLLHVWIFLLRRDLNTSLGLVALSASQQIRMLELLLEHGADKSVSVGGYLAVQLLHHERVEAAKLLRITSGKCSPRESSPNSESPTSQVRIRPGNAISRTMLTMTQRIRPSER